MVSSFPQSLKNERIVYGITWGDLNLPAGRQNGASFNKKIFALYRTFVCSNQNRRYMNSTATALTTLFNRIPRRHSLENVKDINGMVTEYENILITIEAENSFYEKNISGVFDDLENIRAAIKKSTDNKASKKSKDSYFDEASGLLKDSIQAATAMYADGKRMV